MKKITVIFIICIMMFSTICFANISEVDIPYPNQGEVAIEITSKVTNKKTDSSVENYSPLDEYGRVGFAEMVIDPEDLDIIEERGDISNIIPSGWHGNSYFDRCHLIGHFLGGDDIAENLFTGTHYMNVEGMLSYEYKVYYYVTQHGNSVYYRVTPYYHNDKPQCYGVLMEAAGIEEPDWGFTVFVYNISEEELNNNDIINNFSKKDNITVSLSTFESTSTYILNINTGVFHKPSCTSVKRMKESNKETVEDTRENVINRGYRPCEKCHP